VVLVLLQVLMVLQELQILAAAVEVEVVSLILNMVLAAQVVLESLELDIYVLQ
jgi:hypothetical protein